MQERVKWVVQNGIAYVSMTRIYKRNALDRRMLEGLVQTAKKIRKDRSVRAVILSGEGPSFCAGLDFPYVAKNPSIIPRFFLKLPWSSDNMFQRVGHVWRSLPVPVICVIQGHCFGGGLQIALGCDFRYAAPDAQLSVMEIKWGLIPNMSGTPPMNFIEGKVEKGYFVSEGVKVKLPEGKEKYVKQFGFAGKSVILGIRPEDIHDDQIVKDTYKDSLVKLDVDVAELLGAETNIYATIGKADIVAKVNARTDINIGDKIELAFDMNKVHFFDPETEKRIDLIGQDM